MGTQLIAILSIACFAAGAVFGVTMTLAITHEPPEVFDVVAVDQCHCRLVAPARVCSFVVEFP